MIKPKGVPAILFIKTAVAPRATRTLGRRLSLVVKFYSSFFKKLL